MQGDGINATLDLDGLEVIGISVSEESIELVVESVYGAGSCPQCGQSSAEPKDRAHVFIRDLPISGRPTTLHWLKRRWRCRLCTTSWTESHPQIPPRARMTTRYRSYLAERARDQGNFFSVAKAEGISYDTVSRAHQLAAGSVRESRGRPEPKMLCIDEASFKRGHDYNTVVSDRESRYVIEAVRGRDGIGLAAWIFSLDDDVRQGIQAVSMDLWDPYHVVVSIMLPQALRIADKFHVVRLANTALNRVRKRLSGGGKKVGIARQLFHSRHSLLRGAERSGPKDVARLARVFEAFPELEIAWRLKELIRTLYQLECPDEIRTALDFWYRAVESSDIPEFQKLARTIKRYESEVLAYFGPRLTNAYAEGVTNRVKVIKRQAYGLRNFPNFADRVMVQCGNPKWGKIPA